MVHARDEGMVEVTDLHVDRAHREHGIGKMLLASAARTGLQSGKSKISLAAQDNGSGRLTQWYKGMGFAQVGVNQRGYPQLEAPINRVLGSGLTTVTTGLAGSRSAVQARVADAGVSIPKTAGKILAPPGSPPAPGPVIQRRPIWNVIQTMDVDMSSDEDEDDVSYGDDAEYQPGPEVPETEPLEFIGPGGDPRPGSYNSNFNATYFGGTSGHFTLTNSLGTKTYHCDRYRCECSVHSTNCDTYVYVVKKTQFSPTTPVTKKGKIKYITKLERPPICHIVDWVILRDALDGYCGANKLDASTFQKFVCWGNYDNLTTGRRTCNIKSNKNQMKYVNLGPTK
jgi:hypothetical protein